MSDLLRVTWYRSRATLPRDWAGYASVVAVVALLGGLALGALAGARRTQSSFPAFWASTTPSDITGAIGVVNPVLGLANAYNPALISAMARVPHVAQVRTQAGLNTLPLAPDGAALPLPALTPQPGIGYASIDGLGFDQDRLVVTAGRLPDPRRPDEFAATPLIAGQLGLRVGGTVPIGVYTNAQASLPGFGTPSVRAHMRITARLVGLVVLNTAVVQDDANTASNSQLMVFTPALTRPLLGCCVNYTQVGIRVDRAANIPGVEAAVAALLPKGFPPLGTTAFNVAKAERAIKPEAIALAVFGGIAGLAALVVAGQAIARQVRLADADREVLRAIGAGPAVTSTDGLLGALGALVVGAVLAVAIAVGLSPLFPIGPVRPYEPGGAIAVDGAVLGFGTLLLVGALGAVALTLAYRAAPHRAAARLARSDPRGSAVARAAAGAGLPAAAVTGVRFALEPGRGTTSVPVRSAILGAGVAVAVLAATLTFGDSLHTLVSHPSLYGWNWDYALVAGGGSGDIPQQQLTRLLDADRDVAAWAGVWGAAVVIDGHVTPALGQAPGAAVGPAVLSGRPMEAPGETVLGPATLAALHRRVGDTVMVAAPGAAAAALRIVGTAAFPAIGIGSGAQRMDIASGAVVPDALLPAAARNPFNDRLPGPNFALVRQRGGVDRQAVLRGLNAIAAQTSNSDNFGVAATGVLRPAEIVNYRSAGDTSRVLGGALAVGAALALGVTLMASVRRRRRDLALLKALGFTRRQLGAAVAWQATVAVALGTIVGVPLGVALGRWLWDAFAKGIHVVPSPSVPALTVAAIAVGALLLANLVAALPGRRAARTPAALVLRAE